MLTSGRLLQDIQANIIKPHGRKYAWHLFIRFRQNKKAARNWVGGQASGLTTAFEQRRLTEHWKAAREKGEDFDGGLVFCLSLSAKGFLKLGFEEGQMPADPSFRMGMKRGAVNTRLQDPPSGYWEEGYQKSLDAMALLAGNDLNALQKKYDEIAARLHEAKAGEILFTEKGESLLKDGFAMEPFGFRDGISQPRLAGPGGEPDEEKLSLLLPGEAEPFTVGSYVVFRKLEQNVAQFQDELTLLQQKLGIRDEEQVKAQILGRFSDGALPFSGIGGTKAAEEDFDFSEDPHGLKCPFHAHIRKANPRDVSLETEKRQIVRRGMPYREMVDIGSGELQERVGLLFICYQASIAVQFEFIQQHWLNDADFPKKGTGVDPLAGQMAFGSQEQQWNRGAKKVPHCFGEVVKMKGGEYFFQPSRPFLLGLKPNEKEPAQPSLPAGEPEQNFFKSFNRKAGIGRLKLYGMRRNH